MPINLQNLIIESKKGNHLAQIQIYDKYYQAMYNVAYRYLRNSEDAKDAMQEAFLKAFSNLNAFEERKTFGAWLKRIVINQSLDVLKKKKIELIYDDHYYVEAIDDIVEVDFVITRDHVINAINGLSEKYALILNLYLIEGYDHVEISDILNIPVKTSRIQLYRGKKLLKESIKTTLYETGS